MDGFGYDWVLAGIAGAATMYVLIRRTMKERISQIHALYRVPQAGPDSGMVIVDVHNGMVEDVIRPAHVQVVIRDYDVDGSDGPNIREDEDGNWYHHTVW